MDFQHLTTSTPMRRSTRLRERKPDELNSSCLSEISSSANCSMVGMQADTILNTPTKTPAQTRSRSRKVTEPRLKKTQHQTPLSSDVQTNVRNMRSALRPASNDGQGRNTSRKRKLNLQADVSKTENEENTQIEETPKRSRTVEFSDLIEKDWQDLENSKKIASYLQLSSDDGLELSFKTPPARTYSFMRRKSEIDLLVGKKEKIKRKKPSQKGVVSWDAAIKNDEKLKDFVKTFNKELEQIESLPLSVVTQN